MMIKIFDYHIFLFIIILFCRLSSSQDICEKDETGFELITGYVFSSPSETLATIPGTLQINDCIERCHNMSNCLAINFETGLCILFSSSALRRPAALNPSQFPVFTIYAQKICIPGASKHLSKCSKSWVYERVNGYELRGFTRKNFKSITKLACMQKCLEESDFVCRSFNFNNETSDCHISDMDRHTIASTQNSDRFFIPISASSQYYENNCIQEPNRLCEFKTIKGQVLKTVDSVYQDIKTVDACKEKCLNSKYRCYSFDLGDPSNKVCRTSHLDTASLTHINEPYFEIPDALTYELSSCYNVTILCRAREMIARVRTNRIFNGKVYSKSRPNSCVNDVSNSLEFEIAMAYNDVNCNVQMNFSKYSNDIVIQHHDTIVTTRDLGLSVLCSYDLTNRTIAKTIYFEADGDLLGLSDVKDERFIHSSVVVSPNISIGVTDSLGSEIKQAKVGDTLSLRFEISDKDSPYDIFIRDLIATDGTDSSEIVLIDNNGCPTDIAIMGPINRLKAKSLETSFEAFKFPVTDVVQFRAIVTPCLGTCQPVHCFSDGFDGTKKESFSYGKRRRRRDTRSTQKDQKDENNEVVVVQSIIITDGFESAANNKRDYLANTNQTKNKLSKSSDSTTTANEMFNTDTCLNGTSIGLICIFMVTAQVGVILLFAYVRRLNCGDKKKIPDNFYYNTISTITPYSMASTSSQNQSHDLFFVRKNKHYH